MVLSIKRNYNKSTKELALEQIAISTGYRIPASKVIFNVPKALDIFPGIKTDENTYIDAKVQSGYVPTSDGNAGFLYRREDLGVLDAVDDFVITPPDYPYTLLDILPQINAYLGTQLGKDDVVNSTHYDNAEGLILRASPQSLMWVGTKTLSVGVTDKKFLLKINTVYGFRTYTNA